MNQTTKTASEVAVAVVGLSESQAIALIQTNGFTSRIASIDGVAQPGTTDMRINRINLTLENGVVTEASVR